MNPARKSSSRRRRVLRRIVPILIALSCLLAAWAGRPALAQRPGSSDGARLVILMVWDGLRPDSVTKANTPNLYALVRQGAYFADHHAMYPTLTMVNAATLASDEPPSATGIVANNMYLAPLLVGAGTSAAGPPAYALAGPVNLENSALLTALNGAKAFKDGVVEVASIAQELLRKGGYVGIVGKSGPTFLFDDHASAPGREPAANEIFITDDQFVPQSLGPQLHGWINPAAYKAALRQSPPLGEQDALLAQQFIDHVLPAAAAAVKAGRPALAVLWQHNPDITEHAAGLGTAAFYRALAVCDVNLGKLRAALSNLHIEDDADLVVVSDHGFATIKMRIALGELLVAQGLKKSATSDDVIVAHNFGSDTVYLSPHLDPGARVALLHRIVDYAAAQQWCGPIFSRPASGFAANNYLGAIPGTFSQAWFDLFNASRSPDLIVSFRELAGEDNSRLTGPAARALVLGKDGTRSEQNNSQPLVHPMLGVSYADSGPKVTAGNGTHGALGRFEMHNFCAAIGPDFRRSYVDRAPSSNLDVARTIAELLHAQPQIPPGPSPYSRGRVMAEAFKDGAALSAYRHTQASATLDLPGQRVITTIELDRISDEKYPGGATVRHIPAGRKGTTAASR